MLDETWKMGLGNSNQYCKILFLSLEITILVLDNDVSPTDKCES